MEYLSQNGSEKIVYKAFDDPKCWLETDGGCKMLPALRPRRGMRCASVRDAHTHSVHGFCRMSTGQVTLVAKRCSSECVSTY